MSLLLCFFAPLRETSPNEYENFSLVLRPYTSSFLYDDQ